MTKYTGRNGKLFISGTSPDDEKFFADMEWTEIKDGPSETRIPGEWTCTGMGPVEIVEEFRKGCGNTLTHDAKPEDCRECLGYAVSALLRHGFTSDEAVSLLSGPTTKT